MSRRPRAFRLDDPGTVVRPAAVSPSVAPEPERVAESREAVRVLVTEEPAEAIAAADGVPVLPEPRRRLGPWGTLLAAGLGGLTSLAIGLAFDRLVADLFARAPWLGWLALALAALALASLLALVSREVRGVLRERRVEAFRTRAAEAVAIRDGEAAKAVVRDLATFYAGHVPDAARARLAAAEPEIMDADDRLGLAESALLAGRDEAARRAVAAAARQVSLVTAVSPRAIVDVAFVIYAAAKLLGRVARIYGGRPGLFGFLRLLRAAFNHLAVTGGVAVGDSLLQQALGLGLAARVSAKLGEGVLNGLMTARFGLAAIEVCRPLPFLREDPPRIGDVAGELLSRGEAAV